MKAVNDMRGRYSTGSSFTRGLPEGADVFTLVLVAGKLPGPFAAMRPKQRPHPEG